MSAASPNYQKLFEMGKLPKEHFGKINGLVETGELKKEVNRLKEGMCEECRVKLFSVASVDDNQDKIQVRCEVEGCLFMGSGKSEGAARNGVRLHMKSHKPQE